MRKKQLLFVTRERGSSEGLSYAIRLAKAMNEGLSILLICGRKIVEDIEDLATAVTFAEANEPEDARAITHKPRAISANQQGASAVLMEQCHKSGIAVRVQTTMLDAISAIRHLVQSENGVDLVVLAPDVAHEETISTRQLDQLAEATSRSIVTMAKPARAV